MLWQTSKGTIELKPEIKKPEQVAISVNDLLKDAARYFINEQLQEAGAICQTILRLLPDNPDTLHMLGVVYHKAGQNSIAIELIEKAINIKPDDHRYLNDIGEAYRAMDRLEDAMGYYDRALKLKNDFIEAFNNKGVALYNLGNIKEAIVLFEKTLSLNEKYILGMNNMAAALYDLGKNDEAVEYYEKALILNPNSAEAHHHLAVMSKPAPDSDKTRKILELLENPAITDEDAMHLNFALGKIYEDADIYDEAFPYYKKGNDLKRKTIEFDINEYINTYVNPTLQIFNNELISKFSNIALDSTRPIFILGMPRSGTTLVEQIISSHSRVHGAGELPCFEQMEQSIVKDTKNVKTYPTCIELVTPDYANKLYNEYLEHLITYSKDATYVTDKMPGNYQRIGLIKLLFPKARIIHCKRNPLDICVSIYCNFFKGTHNYAYNLRELGLYYLEYERLMSHWKTIFADEIYEIQYEELTQKQEPLTRSLLEYLGLPWENQCLEFYKSKRPVQTASKMQVDKPMYSHSVDRWKNYEKYLGPLIEVLGNRKK